MTDQQVPLFCLHDGQVHHFTPGEVERLVYCLQGVEYDAVMDRQRAVGDATPPARQLDEFDCLQNVLAWSHELEMYAEHVEHQVLRRRDRAGPRPGDTDSCRHCGDLIAYLPIVDGAIPAWRHDTAAGIVKPCIPEPDPDRSP